jgi:DNA-directed RNA polymerase specialized sigma24 family protein
VAEEDRIWARDAEELAACFTMHARDLFGYACMLTEADRPQAGDLVQTAFEAAATVWRTLRDLPADQRYDWLRDTLATALQRRTGHPAGRAFISPSHRRLTELTMARFGRDYDAVAGLDRFAGWLRAQAPVDVRALNSADANNAQVNGTPSNGFHGNGVSPNQGTGSPPGTGAAAAPGSYGDPVSVLYEEHYASLVRLAALLVHDKATAEEIVQDSFVAIAAAWRRRGSLACPLDFLRQSVVERSRSGRYRPPEANGSPNGSAPLLAALGALPARQREVLVMRYYANLSEEQAADAIGISRAAVRRHATRANAALRTLLDAN